MERIMPEAQTQERGFWYEIGGCRLLLLIGSINLLRGNSNQIMYFVESGGGSRQNDAAVQTEQLAMWSED